MIKDYEKYMTSLEEENKRLKLENEKIRFQVDFIQNIPENRLDDLTNLISEFEGIKERYNSAIGAANEARDGYKEAAQELEDLKRELIQSLKKWY